MRAVTPQNHAAGPLADFDGLVDFERSLSFHAGEVALDLSRMEALLAALGPIPRPRVAVHVAGSEGKTSTTELIAAGLSAHGLRTATYTSPHLGDPRERLRIEGHFPADELLREAVDRVLAAGAGLSPTWFEAMTATAAVLFALARVDAVVWETGLGGRLDATRLMPVDACAITTVSLEHTAILGDDLATIAREKAGILRPGVPVALGPGLVLEAATAIGVVARDVGAEVVRLSGEGAEHANLRLAVAVLDLLAARGLLPARTAAVDATLEELRVAGRNHLIDGVLFDGAHTVAAAERLARRLADGRVGRLVFGATSGRNAFAMLSAFLDLADEVLLTRPAGPRGVDPESLLGDARLRHPTVSVVVPAAAALARAVAAGPSRPSANEVSERDAAPRPAVHVLVTGSLHLVGELLPPGSLPA